MYVCMDGWMDGWMYGCVHVCMHTYLHLYIYIYIYICTHKTHTLDFCNVTDMYACISMTFDAFDW